VIREVKFKLQQSRTRVPEDDEDALQHVGVLKIYKIFLTYIYIYIHVCVVCV